MGIQLPRDTGDSRISPTEAMEDDGCVCWQTTSDVLVKNISDFVDFPFLVRSKTSNRVYRDSPEFVVLGIRSLNYVEAVVDNSDEKFSIPVSYQPLATVECKKTGAHVYTTAQELVLDFPRYVVVNASFSLHHRGVSVRAGEELELMRVEKRCENLRGPVSYLICRYEHREIALPMETRGNFTTCVDENIYTVSEIVHKFPLPQIVKFQKEDLIVNDRVKYSFEEDFCGRLTLTRRYSEEYIVGCPINFTSHGPGVMNDSNSDDSGIGFASPTLGAKLVFMNVKSDRQFEMCVGILCDQHEALLNSGRRIYVDKMTDPQMRLSEELTPQNLLMFSLEQVLPNRTISARARGRPEQPMFMNIPPVQHSLRGPHPSLSSPNLQQLHQRPSSMSRSSTYDSTPASVTSRRLHQSASSTGIATPIYSVDGTLPPPTADPPLVLHHIIDLPELRRSREKSQRPQGLLAKVSKSKFGQKIQGILTRERQKKPTNQSDDNEGGFEPARSEPSPIMNNKRMQRNLTYLDESGNDSVSSDDYEHYPGTVDLGEILSDADSKYRRSARPANYFTELGKSCLNDSLRRNNLCLMQEEKVLNKCPAGPTISSQHEYATDPANAISTVLNGECIRGSPEQTLQVNLPTVQTSSVPTYAVPSVRDLNSRVERNIVDIAALSVREVVDCVRDRGLERIAVILERNQVDGEFFKLLTTTDFQHEPFNASPFEIKQLDRIQHGIKPRV